MPENFETPPKDKAELKHRIYLARAALEEILAPLWEAELARPGSAGGWSVLDHLIHLAEWRWKLLAMIHGRPGYEGLQIDQQTFQNAGLDGINAILYARNHQRAPAEILAEFRSTHQAVLQEIDHLAEADLYRPYDLTDPSDARTLLDGIIGSTYAHDLEHLEWIKQQLAG